MQVCGLLFVNTPVSDSAERQLSAESNRPPAYLTSWECDSAISYFSPETLMPKTNIPNTEK